MRSRDPRHAVWATAGCGYLVVDVHPLTGRAFRLDS
jgi:hypothetical protein